jgi:hypothetical protein
VYRKYHLTEENNQGVDLKAVWKDFWHTPHHKLYGQKRVNSFKHFIETPTKTAHIYAKTLFPTESFKKG